MSRPGRPTISYFDPVVFQGDRLDAGLTQSALARAVGLHRTAIGKWERGERQPDRTAYARVIRVLLDAEENSPPEWLWRRYQPVWDLDHGDARPAVLS